MEVLIILFFLSIFVVAPILVIIALISSLQGKRGHSKSKLAEIKVSNSLRKLELSSYVLFENIILPSSGNTAHTEIDHVVVSPYGIFCIETKSHSGSIYAYERNVNWTQYIGSQKHSISSPSRQNYKHVKALEHLIGSNLKAPIHAYVIFPNIYRLVTDSRFVFKNTDDLVERIAKHKRVIYNLDECTRILKALAYASSQKESLSSIHIAEVNTYLSSRMATRKF